MESPMELEKKILLQGPDEMAKLMQKFGGREQPVVEQFNHIFDTYDHSLHQKRYLLRLRQEEKTWFVTAKGPSDQEEEDLVQRIEVEARVNNHQADSVLKNENSILKILSITPAGIRNHHFLEKIKINAGGKKIKHIGYFKNKRIRMPFTLNNDYQLIAEFDETFFDSGRMDYELEIEFGDIITYKKTWPMIEKILLDLGIPLRNSLPKSSRFFQQVQSG